MTQTQSLGQELLGSLVVLLLIVNDTDFIIDHGVAVINPHRLLERHESSLEIVKFKVFHADVERSLVATWEKPICRPVSIHSLICLIQSCESVAERDPARGKMLVQSVGFLKVLPC